MNPSTMGPTLDRTRGPVSDEVSPPATGAPPEGLAQRTRSGEAGIECEEVDRAEIERLLGAIEILSETRYRFGDQRFDVRPGARPDDAMGSALVSDLAARIYENAYTRSFDGSCREPAPSVPDAALIQELSTANATPDRWEAGWTHVGPSPDGGALVVRNGVQRSVPLASIRSGADPSGGPSVLVRGLRESIDQQPGFYIAFGATWLAEESELDHVRFYWNLRGPRDGAPWIRATTARLNRFSVPFRLKCATAPDEFERRDPAVLYVHRRFARLVARLLGDVHDSVADGLDASVPLFTLRLRDGLGFAVDPGSGESFGMTRCRATAAACLAAFRGSATDFTSRIAELHAAFQRAGIDPSSPYRGLAPCPLSENESCSS
ncbi:MAG: T3SS effector HopA1 family protein [Planctomycetota bacterium]